MTYRLIYDALNDGSDTDWIPVAIGILIGVTLTALASRSARRHGTFKRWFVVAWIAAVTLLGGFGFSHVVRERARCRDWLRSGAFEVVEGRVEHFIPMPRTGHAYETFSVQDTSFQYSDHDLSQCGFNNTAVRGGPIERDLPVRITHHGNHILRLEIANAN